MTIRPYKVLLLTCMVNCTAGTPTPQLCPVVSALGSESDNWDSSPGRGKVLRRVGKKKMRTPLLGLAKSIYHFFILITCLLDTVLILKGEILS